MVHLKKPLQPTHVVLDAIVLASNVVTANSTQQAFGIGHQSRTWYWLLVSQNAPYTA